MKVDRVVGKLLHDKSSSQGAFWSRESVKALDFFARIRLRVGDTACRYLLTVPDDAITSCCGTETDRPHRCCHLENNFGSRHIFPILLNRPRHACPKNCPFPWGSGSPPNTRLLASTRVDIANMILMGLVV